MLQIATVTSDRIVAYRLVLGIAYTSEHHAVQWNNSGLTATSELTASGQPQGRLGLTDEIPSKSECDSFMNDDALFLHPVRTIDTVMRPYHIPCICTKYTFDLATYDREIAPSSDG